MSIASMTGFARVEGHDGALNWVWEIKSVNAKALDLRFRLPAGFEALEVPLRASINHKLRRGAIAINISLTRAAGAGGMRINREALAAVMALARELAAEFEDAA